MKDGRIGWKGKASEVGDDLTCFTGLKMFLPVGAGKEEV